MRLLPILAVTLPWPGVASPAALARGSGAALAERQAYGRAVAENLVRQLPSVGSGQRAAPGDAAPPFATIARMPSTTEMSLRAFLQTPHAGLPVEQCRA